MTPRCQGFAPNLIARAPANIAGSVTWRCLRRATHTTSFVAPLKWHDQARRVWKLCDTCGQRMARDTGLSMTDPSKRLEVRDG